MLPILLMVAAGVLLRRRFVIDMQTLVKLNLYLFTAAFVFRNVLASDLDPARMGVIVAVTAALSVSLGLVALLAGVVAGAPWKTTSAAVLAVMIYNSGNYGLPLAELAFGPDGTAVQVFVLSTQTLLTFTLGLALAGTANATAGLRSAFAGAASTVLRLPILYALAAALAWKGFVGGLDTLPAPVASTADYLSAALVPVALVTLGCHLASGFRRPRLRVIGLVAFLRLLAAPAVMAGLLYALHRLLPGTPWDLWPLPAAVLVVTAGVPTAVNTLLITLEVDGDADLAADAVFWTTVLSGFTLVAWIAAARAFVGG